MLVFSFESTAKQKYFASWKVNLMLLNYFQMEWIDASWCYMLYKKKLLSVLLLIHWKSVQFDMYIVSQSLALLSVQMSLILPVSFHLCFYCSEIALSQYFSNKEMQSFRITNTVLFLSLLFVISNNGLTL